jgi:folate-binding protein YgfZ
MADLFHLPERCLIKVSGDEAESFLQNLVTQDMAQVQDGKLAYSCLLTPQGRFLHDFFIFREEGAFFLECETQRREDLLRRLKIFKLRSKVVIEDCSGAFAVYAGTSGKYKDPRLAELGYRSYLPAGEMTHAALSSAYKDHRIHLGVPEGSIDIKPEFDTLADMNLDRLNAVSWTKGCFVGQEVAARMENRGLVKKRLMIISGERLVAGEVLSQSGVSVGDVRSVNAAGTEGLALLKLNALESGAGEITQSGKSIITARLPPWLNH